MVGVSLEAMERDAKKCAANAPFIFSNTKTGQGLAAVIGFVVARGMLTAR